MDAEDVDGGVGGVGETGSMSRPLVYGQRTSVRERISKTTCPNLVKISAQLLTAVAGSRRQ